MTIFIPVIPAPEPGSPKQSDSAQITFSGGPRSGACGDDGGGACVDDDFYSSHPGLNYTVIPVSEPGSPKQSDSAQITFSGGPRSRACGDDDFYSCHPGLNYTVIPAPEPGSPKQSDSAQIIFSGGPRSRACGDDGVLACVHDYF